MTTTTAPTDPPAPPIPAPLPPLPNPLRAAANPGAQAAAAAEGIAALRALANGASNGTTDYPYPTTTDYPLPPLPPVPVPPRTRAARRRSVAGKTLKPTVDPDIPAGSYLSPVGLSVGDAVAAHNAEHPDMPAELRYDRSALLVTLASRGYVWALLRTIGGEVAAEVEVLAVRFFPNPDRRPPPIHALPPQGPAQALSEHLSSLRLSVAKLLYRLPHIVESFGQPCFICGNRLSDVDGLPVGGTGFLAAPPKKAASGAEADKESQEKDKEGKDGDGKDKESKDGDAKDKEDKDKDSKEADALVVPPPDEAAAQGQWVTWHPSCETA
ncbi:uncharacterized protein LOC62_06G008738 [Vanrija pseudolonga]|uniref:Uncharacterized protein n=1 Tax=Vanrija pseudolonga TaxID=143232 RepID=A0AAF0YF77_9TREE|nr:hypothetical protein LOC62_06G008738 [Vanrija pseudolonga]